MKILLSVSLCLVFLSSFAQPKYNAALLDTLDNIANAPTPAKHFAKLYYKAIEITNRHAARLTEGDRHFIFGFESLFAPAFFNSFRDFNASRQQAFSWQRYYADSNLNELQYQFMGMNAHINGDMWTALKGKYDYDTLKKYRHVLIRFQKVFNVFFDSIYVTTGKYKKIQELHWLTLGLDKYIGRHMILHWRKRQVRMALLFYSNPEKCRRRQRYDQKRMLHYDRFAKKWIR
jgi:hypothetical protein